MSSAERAIQVCLVLVAAIHFVPVAGVVGGAAVSRLYGIPIEGPDLTLLMRHRAVLFGIVGGLLVAGAVRPILRGVALLSGLASVVSFLVLASVSGRYNDELARVVAVDWLALILLLAASILHVARRADS